MSKIFLIARREYFAFIRTVGFWLSLVTLPLLITAIVFVPLMLERSGPPENVAVLDLSGDHLEGAIDGFVRAHGRQEIAPARAGDSRAVMMQKMAETMANDDGVRLVSLPAGLDAGMKLGDAEARIPSILNRDAAGVTTILLAYDDGGRLHFHIWSAGGRKGHLEDLVQWDLHGLQYYKLAGMHGIDPALAHDLRETRADIESLSSTAEKHGSGITETLRANAPRFIGAAMGYISWMTIFSSSMILLGGVIEEKASKVLEVLLASAPTEALLIGKVLGVAMVLLTVAAIWAVTGLIVGSYGIALMPPDVVHGLAAAFEALFSPVHIALLLCYFVGGYLMFGVTFAAIGAFCETQKDAQAIMGPVMIVLMIPMLCMQAAFVAPDSPILRYLSWVPIFSPFLMPLRLAGPLPWYEVAGTLIGMAVVAVFMIGLGRRAFKQGALTGGKLTWGTVLRIATSKGRD